MMLFLRLFTLPYFPHPTAAHSWPSNSTFRWDLITARSGMLCLHTIYKRAVSGLQRTRLSRIPPPHLTSHTGRLRKRDKLQTVGVGGRSQIIWQRESLVLCQISISISPVLEFFRTIYGGRNRVETELLHWSASLCSQADRYDNPIAIRFLVFIDCSKIPAHKIIFFQKLSRMLGVCYVHTYNYFTDCMCALNMLYHEVWKNRFPPCTFCFCFLSLFQVNSSKKIVFKSNKILKHRFVLRPYSR